MKVRVMLIIVEFGTVLKISESRLNELEILGRIQSKDYDIAWVLEDSEKRTENLNSVSVTQSSVITTRQLA